MVSFSAFAHFANRYIRCTLIYGDVAKPENGAEVCDAVLKSDVIFGFNAQFILNSRHFFAPENITITVRALFLTGISRKLH